MTGKEKGTKWKGWLEWIQRKTPEAWNEVIEDVPSLNNWFFRKNNRAIFDNGFVHGVKMTIEEYEVKQ